ncbi:hypothetical protein ICW40_03725, partial [Actinotalea ferrariae]|nr:hypothetical protein [Actinotalea ferrariae]
AQAAAVAGDVTTADAHLAAAARLRPWDRDVPLIAAATFREGALAGDPASADAARRWALEALRRTPGSVEAGKALLVAELSLEDRSALATAATLARRAPTDPEVALLEGYALAVAGRWDDAADALGRATDNPFTRARAEALLDEVRARASAQG